MDTAKGLNRWALLGVALIAAPLACSGSTRPAKWVAYESDEHQRPLVQHMDVRKLTALKIAFKLSSRFDSGPGFSISGVALREPDADDQDAELDDDKEGPAYIVDSYSFTQGKCSLEIRIGKQNRARATILESGCDSLHASEAPFGTQAVLRMRKGPTPR